MKGEKNHARVLAQTFKNTALLLSLKKKKKRYGTQCLPLSIQVSLDVPEGNI